MTDSSFVVESTNVLWIMTVFLLYSAFILALGFYVKSKQRKLSDEDKIIRFLSGNGKLGPVSVTMIAVTNMLSAGALIGNPGIVYEKGLLYAARVISSLCCVWFLLGTLGKKMAIVKARTGIQSIGGMIRHRYNSKALSTIICIMLFFIMIAALVSQFTGGAKLFAVLTGSQNYEWGLVFIALVTIIYTAGSGMESMARISVIQGFLMATATISMFVMCRDRFIDTYGSFEAGMQTIATTTDMFDPHSLNFINAFGIALTCGFACSAQPEGILSTFTYNDSKTLRNAILYSLIAVPMILVPILLMPIFVKGFAGAYVTGDYVTPYVAGVVLPGWLGGVVLCGAAAAMQSTCAAFMLIAATSVVKDILHSVVFPNASDKMIARAMPIVTAFVGCISIIFSLRPVELLSIIDIFSNGASLCGLFVPVVIGVHSKHVTPRAAGWSSVIGAASYSVLYIFQQKEIFTAVPPLIAALLLSIAVMFAVNKHSPQVEKGILQVWFGKEYQPEWANLK